MCSILSYKKHTHVENNNVKNLITLSQISTHSRLFTREDFAALAEVVKFPPDCMHHELLQTFQTQIQFCDRIRYLIFIILAICMSINRSIWGFFKFIEDFVTRDFSCYITVASLNSCIEFCCIFGHFLIKKCNIGCSFYILITI